MVRVASVQIEQVVGDKGRNLELGYTLAVEAARNGSEVIVLPELFASGYLFSDRASAEVLAETRHGPTSQLLGEIASSYGCIVVYGYMELDPDTDTLHNAAGIVGPSGLLASYRKLHPFVADQRWAIDGSLMPPVVETPFATISVCICADIEFPEMTDYMARAGATLVCLPTAWVDEKAPSTAWLSRSIESGLPIVAADLAGGEYGVQFSGGSCIIDRRGHVVDILDSGSGVVYGTLDLEVSELRTRSATAVPYELLLSSGSFTPEELAVTSPVARTLPLESTFDIGAVQLLRSSGDRLPPTEALRSLVPTAHDPSVATLLCLPELEVTDPELRALLDELHATFPSSGRVALTGRFRTGGRCGSYLHENGTVIVDSDVECSLFEGVGVLGGASLGVLGSGALSGWSSVRSLAVRGAKVVAISIDEPSLRAHPRSRSTLPLTPLSDRDHAMDTHSIPRLRAGENSVVVALSNWTDAADGHSLCGVYGPDHVTYPYGENTLSSHTSDLAIHRFDLRRVGYNPLIEQPFLRRRKPWVYAATRR